jgi:hypothetical protein
MTDSEIEDIDEKIREMMIRFNECKNIKTVYSCAGHMSNVKKDGCTQVYIMFELDRVIIPQFLADAVLHISIPMNEFGVNMEIGRVMLHNWPAKKKERISISFCNLKQKVQLFLARDFFDRLSETAERKY